MQHKVSAGEMRREYVHSQATTLAGLGRLGATLLAIYPKNWIPHLDGLRAIDWQRSNPAWQERIIFEGRISKSLASVARMTAFLKRCLSLPLSSEEERLESNLTQAGVNR